MFDDDNNYKEESYFIFSGFILDANCLTLRITINITECQIGSQLARCQTN